MADIVTLLGRSDEQAALGALVDAARDGLGGAMVLRGPAGVGKTALLDHVVAAASGLRALRMVGVESEVDFAFAGLHRLLLPFLAGRDELPAAQREALAVACGLAGGPPADRFLVYLAALTLLSGAASREPLLICVDDAQWLDRESLGALGFLGRRAHAEGIATVLAVRGEADEPTDPALDGLAITELAGLDRSNARAWVS